MPHRDERDAELYADPANQVPTGPARRRTAPRGPLTGHVPVRFDDKTIAAVKKRAEADGMTVSAWIRRLVARALAPIETAATESTDAVVVHIPAGARRVTLELGVPAPSTRRRARP
jgi:hypothetical protein